MRYSDDHGFWELNAFPGCNQIVVSNHVLIYPEYRGKGLGRLQHQYRLNQVRALGYDLAICTVKEDNVEEITMLDKNGWTHLTSFRSSETGNLLRLYCYHTKRNSIEASKSDVFECDCPSECV